MSNTTGANVSVSWADARNANKANWDDRAVIHEPAYGVENFDDPTYRTRVIADDLPVLIQHLPGESLEGLDLIHLQCHIGTDTASLAREGAQVTGLDFSSKSLAAAERVAARAGVNVTWVNSDVLEARQAVSGAFDVVYTSIGAICWINDLTLWACQIVELLKPGGVFFIRDGHPMLYAVDENADVPVLRYRYFPNGQAQTWNDGSTYAGEGTTTHTRTYEFPHSISEIISALLGAGLVLERFDEGRTCSWRFARTMEKVGEDAFVWPEPLRDVIPCTFTVVARKPA